MFLPHLAPELENYVYFCSMETMHIDEVKALAERAHRDSAVRDSLFADMLHGEERQARLSAWVLTHLPAADNAAVDLRRDALVRLALATESTSLRRLTLVLLERLEWPATEVRTDLLDFCLQRMAAPDEPYGVRSLCMKLAYALCRHYDELREELRQSLLLMEPSELGAGVRACRTKILKHL